MANKQIFALGINVSLKQYAILVNNTNITLPVTTWEKGAIGEVGSDNLSEVRQGVLDFVNVFANDFLSVNGKD